MEANETESVRINKQVVANVREVVKKTGQTIGGFISIEIAKITDRKLKQLNKPIYNPK